MENGQKVNKPKSNPHKSDPIPVDAPLPTLAEVDSWLEDANAGYATPGFINRLVDAYRKLYSRRRGQLRRRVTVPVHVSEVQRLRKPVLRARRRVWLRTQLDLPYNDNDTPTVTSSSRRKK